MFFRRLRLTILVITFLSIPVFCSVLIPPDEWYIAGILSLTIPAFTLLIAGALIYFILCRSRWAILPAIILCSALPLFSTSFSFIRDDQQFAAPLYVVTHNMNALEFYIKRPKFDSNRQAFQTWIAKNNFDIICLQEMIEGKKAPFLIPGYYKASSSKHTNLGDHLGLFIFSRYPIIRSGKMEFAFNSYNRLMWIDVAMGKDTLRVINVHLTSYDLTSYSVRGNLRKIRAAIRARTWYARLIHRFVERSPYPVILCGDFNETPVSYPYRKINSLLTDAFAGSGAGFQYSFRFLGFPIRIDHIFISPSLLAKDYQVMHGVPWSDHAPVSARIGVGESVIGDR